MIPVVIVRRSRNSSIITYVDDNGNAQACVIDSDLIRNDEIHEVDLKTSTPCGVDWSVVFPEGLTITAEDFQNYMYTHGIIMLEDLKRNPSSIGVAFQSILKIKSAEVYRRVKIALEDYQNDSI